MYIKSATACILALFLLVLPGCSRLYDFDGIVVDGDGEPIAGATVTLYPHDWDRPSRLGGDGESGDDGKFDATWGNAVGVEYFKIVVTADGYRESEQLVAADQKNLRIVLERERESDGVTSNPVVGTVPDNMVFTLGLFFGTPWLRHTLALWQRAMALVQFLVVQASFASFRAVS